MKYLNQILILISLISLSLNLFGQDSAITRIGPNYFNNDIKLDYFFIYDGVPLYKKSIVKVIDTTTIDSIILHKTIIEDYENKPRYNAFIEIRTDEATNEGLKYIQAQTNNWVLENPLALLIINGKKKKWIKALKKDLHDIKRDDIKKIEIAPQDLESSNKYGQLKLTIDK